MDRTSETAFNIAYFLSEENMIPDGDKRHARRAYMLRHRYRNGIRRSYYLRLAVCGIFMLVKADSASESVFQSVHLSFVFGYKKCYFYITTCCPKIQDTSVIFMYTKTV